MSATKRIPSAGVICEFNPFHSGHAYLLSEIRRAVGDNGCVVCLMSGRAVQRGELAMADPYLRANMALAGGADLVLELPFPWSSGSAYHFASAGVSLLSGLGVDTLAFGSESGNAELLQTAAEAVCRPDFGDIYAALCATGMGSTAAYLEAIRTLSDTTVPLPENFPAANDLLGINYLAAIRRQNSPLSPLVIRREGSGYHDGTIHEGEHPSATALRAVIREAACDPIAISAILDGTMPEEALRVLIDAIRREALPVSGDKLWDLCHAFCRLTPPSVLTSFAEMSGGIEGHIVRTAKATATTAEFMDKLRTRQYTNAHLRRAMLFAITGVTEADLHAMPAYTTVLAANERGCKFLGERRKEEAPAVSVITKPADAPEGRQRDLTEQIDALFTLCLPHPKPAGELMKKSPRVEKK